MSGLVDAVNHFHGKNAILIRDLHKEYNSPIIRTAPNEVSVQDVEALPLLYGRNEKFDNRGPFYDLALAVNGQNLVTVRDVDIHRQWRRIWDRAFRTKALEGYGERVEEHVERCVKTVYRHLKEGNSEINVQKLLCGMAFDVMADLGFGNPNYGMLDGSGDSTVMEIMHSHMRTAATISCLRNALEILHYLPAAPTQKRFVETEKELIKKRTALGKDARKDVFAELLEADADTGMKFGMGEMQANIDALVVAGSDTTASVFTNMAYELCRNPHTQKNLRSELKRHFSSASDITVTSVKSLPYLDALVHEVLRLWPATPSGIQARLGPDGATIAGHYVPPWTIVRVNHLALMSNERYFSQPEKFAPGRWLEDEEEDKPRVLDRRAWIPFSVGPHACVGKALAMMELKTTISRLVWEFEMSFGDSFSEEKFREGWKDHFTSVAGEVWVKFTPRKE